MDFLTVVFKSPSTDQVEKIMGESNWCALARYHALEEKEKLEDFIRKVSNDELGDPGFSARNLMTDMGWA